MSTGDECVYRTAAGGGRQVGDANTVTQIYTQVTQYSTGDVSIFHFSEYLSLKIESCVIAIVMNFSVLIVSFIGNLSGKHHYLELHQGNTIASLLTLACLC